MLRLSLVVLILTLGVARSQSIVGIKTIGSIHRFERTTGAAFQAGNITGVNNSIVRELAIDPVSRTAWLTTSANELRTVDLVTGATTLVGTFAPASMDGLDWDGTQSRLWGVAVDNNLYSLDRTTGAATVVGPTGLTGAINIAYDSLRDELLAVDSTTVSLHRIDRTTGAASLISAFNGPQSPGSLTYNPSSDELYLADNVSRGFYRINPVTGLATLVGHYGGLVALAIATLPAADSTQRPHGCGVTLRVDGLPLLGRTLAAEVPNSAFPTFIGLGLRSLTVPFCSCTIGHGWPVGQLGASTVLSIPNSTAFRGVQVAFQAGQLNSPFGCPSPQVAFSDTFVFVID